MISMIAFSILSKPAVLAEALDRGAAVANSEGMQIIPLHLSRAAVRLDPSQPGYVIRTIELYEKMGEEVRADKMRSELIARIEPSIPLLEEEGMVIPTVWIPEGTVIPASPDIDTPAEPAAAVIPAELIILDWDMSRVIP